MSLLLLCSFAPDSHWRVITAPSRCLVSPTTENEVHFHFKSRTRLMGLWCTLSGHELKSEERSIKHAPFWGSHGCLTYFAPARAKSASCETGRDGWLLNPERMGVVIASTQHFHTYVKSSWISEAWMSRFFASCLSLRNYLVFIISKGTTHPKLEISYFSSYLQSYFFHLDCFAVSHRVLEISAMEMCLWSQSGKKNYIWKIQPQCIFAYIMTWFLKIIQRLCFEQFHLGTTFSWPKYTCKSITVQSENIHLLADLSINGALLGWAVTLASSVSSPLGLSRYMRPSAQWYVVIGYKESSFLHANVCGLSWVTRSWFLVWDIAVEFFKCILSTTSRVMLILEQRITPARSRWINSATGRRNTSV